MNYIELFINEPANANLDINQEIDIALQYSIADIKDISKRNASYSKTIILPGTKNNNYWFGNLFDVNADFSAFNPNKKTAAKLIVNSETVMDGFLQLRKITKLNNTDHQGNLINYECVIYNNSVDLMSVIGENTINLLDMSEYGHTFSAANVEASWSHTWEDGYVYPMFGTHTKDSVYSVDYFYPAIFYRAILDQMIREAGFGWTGSLAQNEQFAHEVLSYVSDGRPKIDEDERRSREFWAGRTQSITNTAYSTWNPQTSAGPIAYVSSFATARFNDETTSPFYDNNNNWDTTTWEWSITENGKFSAQVQLYTQLRLWNNNGSSTSLTRYSSEDENNYHYWVMTAKIERFTAGSWQLISSSDQQVAGWSGSGATLAAGASRYIDYTHIFDMPEMDLAIGDKIRVRYRPTKTDGTWFYNLPITIQVTTKPDSWFKNTAISGEITQNEYVDLAKYLPDKVKQKDLLTDLIRRYNLFIQTDPENPKMLIFDTRADFYERGTIVDWTNKKDYSATDDIELLSDLQYKLMIWTYKADTDYYNKEYQDVSGDIYGWYKYYFDNDFVKGESRLESTFSPTPLVKTPFGAIVPAIDPEKPKVQPRIFYYGGLRNCDGWSWFYQPITGGASVSNTFTQYPYAGHFDDPIEPEIDINFGSNKYYFYDDWEYITDNNMFNTYWSDYVRQIETGRLVTSYFYLDEYDIRYIKDNFYTKIFILDSYYYVNKIIDYKPLMNGTTKVELLKIVDGIRWEPKKSTNQITRPSKPLINLATEIVIGSGNTTGGGGVVIGSNNIVSGKIIKEKTFDGKSYTTISNARNMTIGDNNVMSGDAAMIIGDNNTISSNNSFIFGGKNNIVENDNVVLFNTFGITAASSSVVYFGNNFVIDTILGSFSTPYFSSASASSMINGDGRTFSVPVWASSTGLTNSSITDTGATISFGITSSFSGAVLLNNTLGGSQFWNVGIPSSGTGQLGRMSPNKFNAIQFGSGTGTINTASGYHQYLVGGTMSGRKVYLPSYAFSEWDLVISDYSGSASTAQPIEIVPSSGDTINGYTQSYWIDQPYGLIHLYSNAKNGWIVDAKSTTGTASSYTGTTASTNYVYYLESTADKKAQVYVSGSGSIVYSEWDATNLLSKHGIFNTASYDQSELSFNDGIASLRVYDYSTNTDVGLIYMQNINSDAELQLKAIGVTYSSLFNLDANNYNNGTFWRYKNNNNTDQQYIALSNQNILASVNYGLTTSTINITQNTIELTPNSDASHIVLYDGWNSLTTPSTSIQQGMGEGITFSILSSPQVNMFLGATGLSINSNLSVVDIQSNSIKTNLASGTLTSNTSVSGALTQSLASSNYYTYTLTGNTTFGYTNATYSVYNFLIKAGTYTFTLSSASNWQTIGATALGATGSFVMTCIYDGTDMWVSSVKNYQSY